MRNYGGSALMLFVTTAAAIGSYTINLKVSGERAAVERLRRQIVVDARDMRNLQAELRTRARFPEMQRWNDSVLQMSAPSAQQYLRSPVQLASFVAPAPPAGVAPADSAVVRYAVTAPTEVAAPTAALVRAAYVPGPDIRGPGLAPPVATTARLVTASYQAPVKPAFQAPVKPAFQAVAKPAFQAPIKPAFQAVASVRPAQPRAAASSMAADIGSSLDAVSAAGAPRDLLPDGGQ